MYPDPKLYEFFYCVNHEAIHLANSPQARKRARQNTVRRSRNHSQRASMRTSIKAFLTALAEGDKDKAAETYRTAAATIDRTARRGLEHKNKAARLKSRLNARLKAIG